MRKSFTIYFFKLIYSLSVILLIIIIGFYFNTIIYDFSPSNKFGGTKIYNPYKNINGMPTIKANFHAHSKAWWGITNGDDSPEELYKGYLNKGYDLIGISNYHKIENINNTEENIYLKTYEHGINILKAHKLAINTDKVSYVDFPLFQNVHQKQTVISKIKENGGLVSINHPAKAMGHSYEDMKYLSGYNFVEVLNQYLTSEKHWDIALSNGKLVWILGNDDTHGLIREAPFKIWNVIFADKNKTAILEALKKGHYFSVSTTDGVLNNSLKSLTVQSDTVALVLDKKAAKIDFITANGAIYKSLKKTKSAKVYFSPTLPYLRIKITNENNAAIYLNPLIRFNNDLKDYESTLPKENSTQTLLYRGLVFIIEILLVFSLIAVWKFKKSSPK